MVVADTDVVSYLFKRHPLAQAYLGLLVGHAVMVSFMTIAEIDYGMESDGWSENRRESMRRYLDGRFSNGLPGRCRRQGLGRDRSRLRAEGPVDQSQ